MKWFGPTWRAPVNSEFEECQAPSALCAFCERPFLPDDRGLIFLSGTEEDPPELGYHLGCFGISVGFPMDSDRTVVVGQTWQYQKLVPRIHPTVLHEITVVDGNYVESNSLFEDGTRRTGVVLSGVDGAGLRFMIAGGDEVGVWKLLQNA